MVRAGQTPVIGADQIGAFAGRDVSDIGLPCIRINRIAAFLVEPFQFPAAQHEDAAQHELGYALRMHLRVGQRERRTPRPAEHLPAIQRQVLAQALHVGDQIPGRVVGKFGVRRGAPAATLVEQHDAVMRRIEEAPTVGIAARAGTAVHEYHRLAARVAALLVVDRVQRRNGEPAAVVWLDFGVWGAQRGGHDLPLQTPKRTKSISHSGSKNDHFSSIRSIAYNA